MLTTLPIRVIQVKPVSCGTLSVFSRPPRQPATNFPLLKSEGIRGTAHHSFNVT